MLLALQRGCQEIAVNRDIAKMPCRREGSESGEDKRKWED